MKIKPCENYIYFQAKVVEKIGRIEVPDSVQKQEEYVNVLEIGPDVKRIKIGDRLIISFRDVINHKTEKDGKNVIHGFLREENVIALIEK